MKYSTLIKNVPFFSSGFVVDLVVFVEMKVLKRLLRDICVMFYGRQNSWCWQNELLQNRTETRNTVTIQEFKMLHLKRLYVRFKYWYGCLSDAKILHLLANHIESCDWCWPILLRIQSWSFESNCLKSRFETSWCPLRWLEFVRVYKGYYETLKRRLEHVRAPRIQTHWFPGQSER